MSMPSWDLFITLFFIVAIGYGFILQRDKVITTLLSIYTAIVVSQVAAEPVRLFFAGDKTLADQVWIRSNASPFTIQAAVFIAVIVLVSAKSGLSGKGTKGMLSPIELIVYSVLNAALILSSIFAFMSPEKTQAFAESSRMANLLIKHHTLWIIGPIILMIVTGSMRKTSSSSYD